MKDFKDTFKRRALGPIDTEELEIENNKLRVNIGQLEQAISLKNN